LTASSGSVIQSQSTVNSTLSGLSTQLANTSAAYSALTTNSAYTLSGNSLTFTVNNANLATSGANAGVAVFSIDASMLTGQNLSIDLIKNNAMSVIINVTGSTTAAFSSSENFQGGFQNNKSNILFNFQNQTTVSFGNSEYGAILAPNATLTDTGGALNGSVYVENFTQTNEVHLPSYTGFVPSVAVPEPASVLSTSVGLALVALKIRRRRRRGTS
jgi:choice-of-anchor A domain-containing protein